MLKEELFYKIVRLVKTKENYVPRNYQTVGGMWTVDTYKLGNATVQLMDDGYTLVLIAPEIHIIDTVNDFEPKKGTEKDLKELYKMLASL